MLKMMNIIRLRRGLPAGQRAHGVDETLVQPRAGRPARPAQRGRRTLRSAIVTLLAIATPLMLVLAPQPASAQLTRGAIAGTVRDASGSVVPGAVVTVTNVDTNAARTAVSDAHGFFRAGALEPGRYRLLVALSGFLSVERTDIDVQPATDVSLDIVLKPASIAETITVDGDDQTANLSTTSPTIGFTTSGRMVVDLPLSVDRNINNILLTVPNALATNGQGTYAINGQRPRNNNYMVDGSDNNDITVTIPTSVIVPEAVAEFQVLQNPYSAEFGRNSGGQINVITKSGTSRLRGEAWDYFFTNAFSSVDNLEAAQGRTKPAKYTRHQLGGDLGGPIVPEKLFFYGLYQRDAQRPEDRPSSTSVRIPTMNGFAALQNVPLAAGQTQASRGAVLQRIDFLRDIYAQNVAFRNLQSTMVNGVDIETGLTNVNITDPSTYHTALGRLDYHAGGRDNLTLRYSLNNREDVNAVSNCGFGALFCGSQTLVDTNVAASHAHVFTARTLNEFRFSLVRRDLEFPENDPSSPTANISGLFTIGGANNFPQSRVSRGYQFSDTFTWTPGRHTIRAGADLRYNDVDNVSAFDAKGTFTFNSLQDYINNSAFELRQAQQVASWHATQWQTFLFVQDDFRIVPDLTITMGLRFERSPVPLGLFGATDTQSLGALVPPPATADTNWAPRVGFAWTPRGSRAWLGKEKTVVRGGFGVGYDLLFYNLLTVNGSNYPRIVVDDRFNLQDAYPNLAVTNPGATPVFDPLAAYTNSAANAQSPESRFYSLTMQREAGRYLFEAGYSGSRGAKGVNQILVNPAILTPAQAARVVAARDANAIPDAQARRLYPQYGARTLIPAYVGPGGNDVEARSTYDAVFFSATRRLSRGVQFRASYTYSRWYSNNDGSLTEGGTDASSQRPQDNFDYAAEWSRSQFDRPHRFAAAYLWEVPGPTRGVAGLLFGGWQLAGVTQAQSGRPFTIVTGVDSNGDGNTGSDRPNIDPTGSLIWDAAHSSFVNNGYYVVPLGTNNLPLANSLGNGNAPRNGERAAPYWTTDLSFSKRFPVRSMFLVVRLDAFNLFKQANYGAPVLNMSSPSFGQNTNNWGRRTLNASAKMTW